MNRKLLRQCDGREILLHIKGRVPVQKETGKPYRSQRYDRAIDPVLQQRANTIKNRKDAAGAASFCVNENPPA